MEVIIVFVCFMIAPALIIYSLVRILTGNMTAKPTGSDKMEYNALFETITKSLYRGWAG